MPHQFSMKERGGEIIYTLRLNFSLLYLSLSGTHTQIAFQVFYNWSYQEPGSSDGKEYACNAEDPGLIPGSGRSPGGGNGNPLQYSCLENSWTEEPAGYNPWCLKESDTTKGLTHTHLTEKRGKQYLKLILVLEAPTLSFIYIELTLYTAWFILILVS